MGNKPLQSLSDENFMNRFKKDIRRICKDATKHTMHTPDQIEDIVLSGPCVNEYISRTCGMQMTCANAPVQGKSEAEVAQVLRSIRLTKRLNVILQKIGQEMRSQHVFWVDVEKNDIRVSFVKLDRASDNGMGASPDVKYIYEEMAFENALRRANHGLGGGRVFGFF